MHNFEWDKVLFLEKGKKGLHRVIFGRTLLIVLSFLVQFGLFFLLFSPNFFYHLQIILHQIDYLLNLLFFFTFALNIFINSFRE